MKLRPVFSSSFTTLLLHNRVICYGVHVTFRNSVVVITTGYGLEGRGVFQTGSGVHPDSCPMGTEGSFPG
jgi:hypothetical protein